MGEIIFKNNTYIYISQNQQMTLLSCRDYLANRSRIPLHTMEDQPDGILTIPVLIENLQRQFPALSAGTSEAPFAAEYLLMQLLVISRLMESPLPVKACEFGCGNGVMSYFLSALLGLFNENSSLCCITETIGNDSQTPWLDRISLLSNPPRLSWLATDYDDTPLSSGYFDLVLINGSNPLEQPADVVREAERLTKKNGVLLCYSCHLPALTESFGNRFPHAQVYTLQEDVCMMATGPREISENEPTDWSNQADHFIENTRKLIRTCRDAEAIRRCIKQADRYLDESIAQNELTRKQQLIRLEEDLLNTLL